MNLKDIFTPIILSEGGEPTTPPEETSTPIGTLNRMQQLTESFEKKNEIIKENIKKQDNTEKLQEESKRFSKLSKHRLQEWSDSVNQSGMKYGGGYGHTVSNFMDNEFCAKKFTNVNKANLTDSEALELSIKRVLKSGTPIENIGMYDEINHQLNGLGFQSKLPNDIKVAVLQLIQQGGLIKDNISE